MSAGAALGAARAAGIAVTIEHGNLRARPTPPPEIVAALRQHKAALIELLTQPAEPWRHDPAEAHYGQPIAWTDRQDVIAVVEDLADERMRPRRIAATLGVSVAEVVRVLRRTGR